MESSDAFEEWWDLHGQIYCKFTAKSNGKKRLKIGKQLAKLWARVQCFFSIFVTHRVQLLLQLLCV